jgi:homopolymeric O-antigen transport system permease protein
MSTSTPEALPSALPSVERRRPFERVIEGFRELLGRHRLIAYLVRANMKRTHADSFLGQLWWVIDPLLQMAIYAVLVSITFLRPTPDYPLFIFAAILPWKWFATTLSAASVSVTGREGLIRQVQFPKIVLPAASTLAGTVSFGFGLIALGLMYVFYLDRLSPMILLIPVIAAVQLVFTLACAILLAALNAFYRDVQNVLGHVVRLWFYLSPALYSLDHIAHAPTIRTLLSLNPMAPILESYRDVIYGSETGGAMLPDFGGLLAVLLFSFLLLALAVGVFKRVEPAFARIL